ncbi:class I SAM-dependent methyltransferase [Litoribacillus peritrichatus]|uniref:Class I SAM-dependent methyltransferase n=1 Tax=Litoribacillus peritrichatus TaxID=718191 RepID=A0ABP7M9M5_9GAMM
MTTPSPLQYIARPQDLEQSQRLFHGRGHYYPGLEHVTIDWIAPAILITLFAEPEQEWLDDVVKALVALFPECESLQVQYRCRSGAPFEIKQGEALTKLVAVENGLKYHISLGKAQNTGLFLDIINGRQWLREHSQGKNVLNLFSYTCGFSVAAIEGGADQVVNVDMSKPALTTGRENHRLNDHPMNKVVFHGVDIFKSWGRIKKQAPYDILVSDPPSFQKGSVDIQRDYYKIINRIPQLVKPGGIAMLCLNSPDLSDDFLLNQVAEHCPDCKLIEKIHNPDVYVEAHEGKGLKVYLFQYL